MVIQTFATEKRHQSVIIFRHLLRGAPDVIPGEVDMFPAQWGEMGEEAVWNLFDLAQGGDSALKIPRVPKGSGANSGSGAYSRQITATELTQHVEH